MRLHTGNRGSIWYRKLGTMSFVSFYELFLLWEVFVLATILYSWYVIMSLPLQYDAIMKGITCVLIEGVCWSTVYSLE